MVQIQRSTKFIGGGVLPVIFIIVLYFIIVPIILQIEVAKEKRLIRGSLSRNMWEKLPTFVFNIYIFNCTNPDDVTQGARPIVEQIGPFSYFEDRHKSELQDRESDDTVAFRPMIWWHFNKDKSGDLTGDEFVTVPNAVLLSIVTLVEREMLPIMGVINLAINELFQKPDSPYMTVRVRKLLFEGVPINCDVKGLSTIAICGTLGVIKSNELKKISKNQYTFSFLGSQNGTLGDWHRVIRGTKDNSPEVGKMVEYKGKSKLNVWTGRCNELKGTDGTSFPPFLTDTTEIYSFAPDICRAVALKYEGTGEFGGLPIFRYSGGLGDIPNTEDEVCFCRSNASCPRKGTLDLSNCKNTPVVASLPHFYQGAGQYQAGVDGLNPEQSKHEIFAEIEPTTGTPVRAMSRLQFNIEMKKIGRVTVMKKLLTTMHPIFWIEEEFVLPEKFINKIDGDLYFTLRILKIVCVLIVLLGLALIVFGVFLRRKRHQVSATQWAERSENASKQPRSIPSVQSVQLPKHYSQNPNRRVDSASSYLSSELSANYKL